MAAELIAEEPPEDLPEYKYWWNVGARLDQGNTGTCVAHAWVHMLENSPITRPGTVDPMAMYDEIVKVDEWTENDNDTARQFGTSIRAGAKIAQQRGYISEYRWAFDLATALRWLLTQGPVVIGVNWYTGMFYPDADNFIEATGQVEGGHAVVLDGINMKQGKVRGLNSWGPEWGDEGKFYMTFDTFAKLITERGEVCMALEVAA